ncbi:MAG: LLM class flavin-dependent oxidoreductase [Chloroflexi bacterium]|nr:LLM class flavin-dependent oxidoreductase [Chloroflexota bacterium]
MRYAVSLPAFGRYSDPHQLASLARRAEDAGWDAFFIWDHVIFDPTFNPMADPWVALAAVALSTTRIRLGTMVTPVPRRRPWKLARETVSLDRLSGGRLIFGAGLGDPVQWDYGWFDEDQDAKIRAAKLDEGLDILTGLWTGEMFSYQGQQYRIAPMRFEPTPVQQPRIPIWIGGTYDKLAPQRRAARFDGYVPLKWGEQLTLDEWAAIQTYIGARRTSDSPFDFVHGGTSTGTRVDGTPHDTGDYAAAGVTWWVESVDPWRFGHSYEAPIPEEAYGQMEARITAGPPK